MLSNVIDKSASELITRNFMLASLPQPLLDKLAPHLSRIHLPQGTSLIKPNREIQWVYFLERGMASMNSLDLSGAAIEVGIVGREGVIGISALLGQWQTKNAVTMQGAGEGLLYTRNLVLQQTGAEIYSAKAEPAVALLDSQYFDVIVLCHTLSSEDTTRICRLAELFWPVTRLLFVGEIAYSQEPTCNLDVAFPWRLGPLALVELTRDLLNSALAQQSKRALVLPFPANNAYPELHRGLQGRVLQG